MSQDQQKEIERLKRLREQQLRSRDPHKGTRTAMKAASDKYKKRGGFALSQLWKEMDHVYQGMIIGLLIGLVAAFAVSVLVTGTNSILFALLALFLPFAFGMLVGAGLDWRDEVRRLK